MRYINLLFLAIASLFVLSCKDSKVDSNKNISSSWTAYLHSYKFGEYSKHFDRKITFEFESKNGKPYLRIYGAENTLLKEIISDTSYLLTDPMNLVRWFWAQKNDEFETTNLRNSHFNFLMFRWVELTKYDNDGSVLEKHKKVFNEKGLLIRVETYDEQGKLGVLTTKKYDIRGNLIEETNYNSEGAIFGKNIYKYNDRDNKTEFIDYDSSGNLTRKEIISYDNAGRKREYYSKFLDLETITLYDTSGNETEVRHIGNDLISKYKYVNNRLVEEWNESKGLFGRTDIFLHYIYEYDTLNGRLIASYALEDSVKKSMTKYIYDAKGKKIEELYNILDGNEGSTSRKWEYDRSGNLLREDMSSIIVYDAREYKYDSQGRITDIIFIGKLKEPDLKVKIIYNEN